MWSINLLSTLLFLTGSGADLCPYGNAEHGAFACETPGGIRSRTGCRRGDAVFHRLRYQGGLFPLFFWLPASYHTPPVAVSAIFSGLLTKVGVYAMIRAFTLIFPFVDNGLRELILACAVLTMVIGVVGAASHNEVRRILSFHIISQVGYMVLGLGLFTPLALAGTVFYLLHHIVVKSNLFLISGLIRQWGGSFDLAKAGGLYRYRGIVALLFFIPAFSLAGFPPLSGFWAKMILIKASIDVGYIRPCHRSRCRRPFDGLLHDQNLERGLLETGSSNGC
jgi:multicomponent Na+:H+ antiporter subunit D